MWLRISKMMLHAFSTNPGWRTVSLYNNAPQRDQRAVTLDPHERVKGGALRATPSSRCRIEREREKRCERVAQKSCLKHPRNVIMLKYAMRIAADAAVYTAQNARPVVESKKKFLFFLS